MFTRLNDHAFWFLETWDTQEAFFEFFKAFILNINFRLFKICLIKIEKLIWFFYARISSFWIYFLFVFFPFKLIELKLSFQLLDVVLIRFLVVQYLGVFNFFFIKIRKCTNIFVIFRDWISWYLLCSSRINLNILDWFWLFFIFGTLKYKFNILVWLSWASQCLRYNCLSLEVIIKNFIKLFNSCFALLKQVLLMSNNLIRRTKEVLCLL